jgi:hypothetical protein
MQQESKRNHKTKFKFPVVCSLYIKWNTLVNKDNEWYYANSHQNNLKVHKMVSMHTKLAKCNRKLCLWFHGYFLTQCDFFLFPRTRCQISYHSIHRVGWTTSDIFQWFCIATFLYWYFLLMRYQEWGFYNKYLHWHNFKPTTLHNF